MQDAVLTRVDNAALLGSGMPLEWYGLFLSRRQSLYASGMTVCQCVIINPPRNQVQNMFGIAFDQE